MKIFTRCRILKIILKIIDVILGLWIVFQISEIPDAIKYNDPTNNRFLLLFSVICLIFAFVLLVIIALHCVIKDADEDISAVMNLQNQSKKL